MKSPKLRIIAGPNGSGKSTLIEELRDKFKFGHYLNADDIEKGLKEKGSFDFTRFKVKVTQKELEKFTVTSGLYTKISDDFTFKVTGNMFLCDPRKVNSYTSLIIVEFLRGLFIKTKQSFSFETVMSDERKIKLMEDANKKGFRIYFYFICTNSPQLNVARVAQRVKLGGHPVDEGKIVSRYHKSLTNLLPAIKLSNRGYIFDNSSTEYEILAESIDSKSLRLKNKIIPSWFFENVIQKLSKN